jgi:hypothetical protein
MYQRTGLYYQQDHFRDVTKLIILILCGNDINVLTKMIGGCKMNLNGREIEVVDKKHPHYGEKGYVVGEEFLPMTANI